MARRRASSTRGEGSSIKRAFLLMSHLLEGKLIGRKWAAELLDIQPPAAADYLAAAKEILDTAVTEQQLPGSNGKGIRLVGVRQFSASEEVVLALCLVSGLAAFFDGSPYGEGLRRAVDHIVDSSLNPARYEGRRRKFFFRKQGGESSLPDARRTLRVVLRAVVDQKTLRIHYRHFSGEVQEQKIHPLSVVIYQHQLYLIARDAATDQIAHPFRFSRIIGAERAGVESFEYPERDEFDTEKYFRDSFGVFAYADRYPEKHRVVLTEKWRPYVRSHRWHASQGSRVVGDGVEVTMQLFICPEVESWVLSFGEEIEVMEPNWLREKIAARAAAAAERYRRPPE